MLDFDNVSLVHAGSHVALQDVTLHIAQGEQVAVIGPSGAGKTTLLRIAGASLRPSAGTATVLGVVPWRLSAQALRRLRSTIGLASQAPAIPLRLRVITAVLAGKVGQWPVWRSLLSLMFPSDVSGASSVLARMQLGDRLWERCDRLSGGQLQRVGIARLLYQSPRLMLADEPVSALDPALSALVLGELIAKATESKATLVASLHAVDLALQRFPRIVGLKAGRIAFDLPRSDVTQEMLRSLYRTDDGAMIASTAPDVAGVSEPQRSAPKEPVTGAAQVG